MLHVAARVSGLHTIHTVWIVGVVVTLAWASAPLLISGAALGSAGLVLGRGHAHGARCDCRGNGDDVPGRVWRAAAVGFTVSRGQRYGDASSRARRHRDAIRSTLVAASWSEATSKP